MRLVWWCAFYTRVHVPEGTRRVVNLPALRVAMDVLVAAIRARTGSVARVVYAPDPATEAMFGRLPPLTTALGDALGFRHDGSLEALVSRVLAGVER